MTSKLGLIGLRDTFEARFDWPEGFGYLVTSLARFDRLPSAGEPESANPRDAAVAASAIAGYGVPGQIRDEPDAQLSVRDVAIGLCFYVYACVNSRVTQVGVAWRSCASMNSCVTQLFLWEQLRDAAVLVGTVASLKQLRDAATEMRGATSWLRGASVLKATYFKQLRDATVEWCGASAEMRYAAVLQGAQLGSSCVTQLCRRVTRLCCCVTQLWLIWARPARVDQPLMSPGRHCWLWGLRCRIAPHAASFPVRYAICIDGAVERLSAHLRVRVQRDDSHTRRLRCYYWPALHWSSSPAGRSIPDGHSRGPISPFLARCHLTDLVHRAGMYVL
ncbi:hypothetical protein JCGZ_03862 [Jatropha curcas]|uniref:Uncharacterized protein n=1 Tax=Jatropha curcas TaxID=180498 RepID=A0A067JD29_JATCU|nr:hypothetical protein JCGZ_03862 [Jatropha curcas]